MKITAIESIPVCVPLKAGLTTKTAHGEHIVSEYVIIRVHNDAGLIGLGEATVAVRWTGETAASCIAAIDNVLAPALVCQDPTQISLLRNRMERELKLNPFTKAGVEMALWDLAGKAAGLPVYQMLGGKLRDEIPIKMVVGAFPPEQAVRLAEKFLSSGVRCLKVKVGLDPAQDIERVKQVRRFAGPSIPIGIDANCGWSQVPRAPCWRGCESDILFAEQPIAAGDPQTLALLRQSTTIPIMADESVFTLADAWQLASNRAVNVLSIYPGKHGGILGTVEIAHLAKAAGIACCIGSNLELGIGTAAMLHVACALDAVDSVAFPADIIGPLYHQADLLRLPLQLGPAVAKIPTGPGLGVELDEEQLTRFRTE